MRIKTITSQYYIASVLFQGMSSVNVAMTTDMPKIMINSLQINVSIIEKRRQMLGDR